MCMVNDYIGRCNEYSWLILLSVWCDLNPLKGVLGRESIAQCHG
jgi:hypothetical protein